MKASFLCRLLENHVAVHAFQRRQGMVAFATGLERMAPFDALPFEIAGLSGNAADFFELVEKGLDFLGSHGEILNGDRFSDLVPAIALNGMAVDLQICGQRPPDQAAPVKAAATHSGIQQDLVSGFDRPLGEDLSVRVPATGIQRFQADAIYIVGCHRRLMTEQFRCTRIKWPLHIPEQPMTAG